MPSEAEQAASFDCAQELRAVEYIDDIENLESLRQCAIARWAALKKGVDDAVAELEAVSARLGPYEYTMLRTRCEEALAQGKAIDVLDRKVSARIHGVRLVRALRASLKQWNDRPNDDAQSMKRTEEAIMDAIWGWCITLRSSKGRPQWVKDMDCDLLFIGHDGNVALRSAHVDSFAREWSL